MNFTNRTTYLTWVQNWKIAYLENSAAIRATKAAFRQAQRTNAWAEENKLRRVLATQVQLATQMLRERARSKVEAQRQYTAGRCTAPDAAIDASHLTA